MQPTKKARLVPYVVKRAVEIEASSSLWKRKTQERKIPSLIWSGKNYWPITETILLLILLLFNHHDTYVCVQDYI